MTAAIPEVKFFPARRRAVPAIAIGVLTCGVGGYLALTGERQTGLTGVGFGVFLILWFGLIAWWPRPMLWFDAAGLGARLLGFGFVAWTDIDSVRLQPAKHHVFLVLDRTPVSRNLRPMSRILRAFASLAKADDLAVPINGLQQSPEQIVAAVRLAHEQGTGERAVGPR